MNKTLVFPTAIYSVELDDAEMLNPWLRSHLYSIRDQSRKGLTPSGARQMGAWQSADSLHELTMFGLFLQRIQELVDGAGKDQDGALPTRWWCAGMQASICDRYGYEKPLDVGSTVWSGIYAVQRAGDDHIIEIEDPRNGLDAFRQTGKASSGDLIVPVQPGTALLFPSWLSYRLRPNRSDIDGREGERITISFGFNRSEQP